MARFKMPAMDYARNELVGKEVMDCADYWAYAYLIDELVSVGVHALRNCAWRKPSFQALLWCLAYARRS